MNWEDNGRAKSPQTNTEPDVELAQALKHFKAGMDAWSDAAYRRPRTAAKLAVRHSWRMAASWAMACLLVIGSLAGAAHVVLHRQQMARIAAQKAAEQRAVAAQPASGQPVNMPTAGTESDKKTPAAAVRKVSAAQDSLQAQDSARGQDDDLLATVDNDVSRGVPAAMEPLAQLMNDGGSQ